MRARVVLAVVIFGGASIDCWQRFLAGSIGKYECILVVGLDLDARIGLRVQDATDELIGGKRCYGRVFQFGRSGKGAHKGEHIVNLLYGCFERVAYEYDSVGCSRMAEYGLGFCGAEFDKAGNAGSLNHALGVFARLGVDIRGDDARLTVTSRFLALVRLRADRFPGFGFMQPRSLKPPFGTHRARSTVHELLCRFDQQTAAGAREVDERRARPRFVVICRELSRAEVGPAHLREHECGVVGAKHVGGRSFRRARRGRWQALEERLARKVEIEARAFLAE